MALNCFFANHCFGLLSFFLQLGNVIDNIDYAFTYRKNPAHIREFSHDIAADSGSDDDEEESSLSSDKPVCQYGSRCYRSNPAHLREYYHPPPGEPEGKPASRSRPKRSRAAKGKESSTHHPYV